ncbi:MAG: methionine--tRNA ligase [Bacilli bacterium]|nr:methionine--tRNA ligase [Bacilli bacterium]
MKKKFYITTPIYYPSAEAHIGHAYCTTVCDILARYKRMRGVPTYFLTGTDEHGEKIQKKAQEKGVTPQQYVDEIADKFKQLWKAMRISNDDFIRTTEDRHTKVVQDIFTTLYNNDDIYLGKYEGWYCTPCESFWTDTQVGEEHLCPDCHRPVHRASEESYFFKTNKYLPQLLEYMDQNPKFILPLSRKNEMMNTFIKPGLNDLCVSRTSFDWGVQIRENPKHVIYVWMDALSNYITALGYGSDNQEKFKQFWEDPDCEIVHIVGADISRFHVIYWPMFLMGLNLRLPDRVFVHGLLDLNGEKMSKSRGNVINPVDLINRYGVDTVRWYLAREMTFGSDGKFTPELFVERINMDLANNYGNLINRTSSMIIKYFGGVVPELTAPLSEFDKKMKSLQDATVKLYESSMDDLKLTEGLACVMEYLNGANKYIEETTPWVLAKENRIDELKNVMCVLANAIVCASIMLKPALVESFDKVMKQFNVPEQLQNYENNVYSFCPLSGVQVTKESPLFPRLDKAIEVEFISSLSNKK